MVKGQNSDAYKLLYIVTYLFTWISGIIIYVTEGQKNKRLMFHSLQAIFLGIIILIVAFIPFVGVLAFALWVLGVIIGIIAYTGIDVSLPLLGRYAKQYSKWDGRGQPG